MRHSIVTNVPAGLAVQQSVKKRVMRKPQHRFNLQQRPYELQPFMIAPVLAGETLETAMLQSRIVSDPVKSPVIGWWYDYFFFYVPLRAMEGSGQSAQGSPSARLTVEQMLLDLNAPMADDVSGGDQYYTSTSMVTGYNWLKYATEAIVANFFRDEGEAVDGAPYSFSAGSLPLAKINTKSVFDSLYKGSDIPDVVLDQTPTADIDMMDLNGKFQMWEYLRSQKMTEQTFEDYLETFGVRSATAQTGPVIELLRHVSQFQYPSNTVNNQPVLDSNDAVILPAGAPSSALSWSFNERLDKARFFKEPGFIIGLSVTKFKLYFNTQLGHASHMLQGALDWMPALLKDRVDTSIRQLTAAEGILAGLNEELVLDLRDLFVYGDQFVNWDVTTGMDGYAVALPRLDTVGTETNAYSSYITSAMANGVFVDPAQTFVRSDGVVHLNIMGTQMDHT